MFGGLEKKSYLCSVKQTKKKHTTMTFTIIFAICSLIAWLSKVFTDIFNNVQ